MRNMSFALTTPQIIARTKTVTRRMGWLHVKPGELIQPVEKSQGLKKGETIKRIGGPIRIRDVSREPLCDISKPDVGREGFEWMSPREFVSMFCDANACRPGDVVTRIEFEYAAPPATESE